MDVVAKPIFGIVSNPNLRSGRPIIDGTTIRVMDVVALYKFKGRTPEQIAADYALTLTQVHAALAYYYAHQGDIDAELERERRAIEAARERSGG
jgi:uncharacterized protein (DUF433 family)